ncbi:MAG: SDR family oxidoreductase [Candidatus Lambdaproteobacteria bacterium]|nr:SDR family oxidoreductase [Candidatus Lambdaproteobacteria bacterium]
MSAPHTRVILITGAGRGLGRALALHLAAPDTLLLLHHHQSRMGAQDVARQAQAQGARTLLLAADLADAAARTCLMQEAAAATPHLNVLINNVGVYEEVGLGEIEPAAWARVLEVTCNAVQHLIHAAWPLLAAGAPARVINLGDSAADRITARTTATHYHAAKLGVHLLTRSYAKLLGPQGITVNQVSPGFLEGSIGEPGSAVPLGRLGRHADILGAVDYLLSPQAAYVSGANLLVSGGWNL